MDDLCKTANLELVKKKSSDPELYRQFCESLFKIEPDNVIKENFHLKFFLRFNSYQK